MSGVKRSKVDSNSTLYLLEIVCGSLSPRRNIMNITIALYLVALWVLQSLNVVHFVFISEPCLRLYHSLVWFSCS